MRAWACALPVAALVLAGVCLSGGNASAQQAVSATVGGTVTDSAGQPLPGAAVRLAHRETNLILEAGADDRGRFRFLFVPVGPYRLSAQARGYAVTEFDVELLVGQVLDVPVPMTAAVNESVTVRGEAPLVEAGRTAVADTVAPYEVESLPLNGRNYLDLSLLVPGVSRTTTRNSERFAETSAVPGTGVSVSSQRNLGNTFVVDGLSANDDAADLAGTAFAQEVIREFQVITAGGSAEFGRASSGIVSIVTRSGGNAGHGRGYGFYRNGRWDARNALATRRDPLSQRQFGGSLSGPLVRDRLFFFANVERTQHDKNGVVTVAPSSVARIEARLQAAGYPGPRPETGEFRTGYDATNVFGRVDWSPASSSRLQVRYGLYDVRSANARGVGGLNTTSRGTRLDNRDHVVAGTWQRSWANAVNEVRAQWVDSQLAAPANDPVGPAVAIAGVANIGTAGSSPTGRDIRTYQLADTVTLQRGRHVMKGGVDVLYNRVAIEFPGAVSGSYTFTSLASFEQGVYQQYQQAFGDSFLSQRNPNLGIFLQDEWRVADSVTLNAGLRYDLQWLPAPLRLDADNLSPRLGLAWASADRRAVARVSAGVYFDRIPLRATSNALQRDGVRYQVAILAAGQAGAPVFPQTLPAFPADAITSITTMDPRIQNGRSEQLGAEVERAVGSSVAVSAGYTRLRGRRLIMSRNVNVPTFTAAEAAARGIPNLGRPNPAFGNISRFESIGDSWFHGMTLAVQSQPRRWGHTRMSYTLSTAADTAGNAFFSSPQDNADIAAERGPSDNDQRHRVTISGTVVDGRASGWRLGLELGYVVSVASGVPFTPLAGSDLNNDTNTNDRPAGVGRNSQRQPATATVDLRVSRAFDVRGHRLQLLVEGFNVLNRVNVLAVNSTFGTGVTPLASFRQPTVAGDPRQLQLGLRWSF